MIIKYKKAYCISILLITILLIVGCSNAEDFEENIRNDYITYYEDFENVVSLFPVDNYYVISSENFDESNSHLVRIFKELQYNKIYSDYKGNVFFDKYGDGLGFYGLVYLRSPEYVIDILKTRSHFIDQNRKWCIYYAHGL